MVVEVEHPQLGKMWHVGTPLRLGGTPAPVARAAPLVGEHTEGAVACGGLCGGRYRRLTGAEVIL